jgi:2-iminobutanoate/2-iminopropanoate deaminase
VAKVVSTPAAPQAIGPYSQALEVRPARILCCSGQIPLDPATGELVQGDIRAQTERVMQNVESVLAAAGMGLADVVKSTVFLVDLADFAGMNEVYGKRFSGACPARSTVQVAALPRGARVEIEVLAVREGQAPRAGARPAHRPSGRKTRKGGGRRAR